MRPRSFGPMPISRKKRRSNWRLLMPAAVARWSTETRPADLTILAASLITDESYAPRSRRAINTDSIAEVFSISDDRSLLTNDNSRSNSLRSEERRVGKAWRSREQREA